MIQYCSKGVLDNISIWLELGIIVSIVSENQTSCFYDKWHLFLHHREYRNNNNSSQTQLKPIIFRSQYSDGFNEAKYDAITVLHVIKQSTYRICIHGYHNCIKDRYIPYYACMYFNDFFYIHSRSIYEVVDILWGRFTPWVASKRDLNSFDLIICPLVGMQHQ